MDKLVTLRLAERLKNRYFILESKMAELNPKEKQPDQPDAVSKLFFGNKSIAHWIYSNLQHECLTRATRVWHEEHECNTSATLTTRVRQEWDTSNTSATQVQHDY